ncbi:DUF5928 domain-containing protein [Roseobacter sp.]|uniref:DUF5928 domain-containing protein n=1 Tax=Roseobacter sp. TaxID=1907202 RepID=UPI003296E466
MAKIAYILLCHKDPDAIIQQAERLTSEGDYIAIHFDARAQTADYEKIRKALMKNENVALTKRRIKCGWGEWSLVQATLTTLETALETFPRASHFYMLSGDCMPIKTAQYIHQALDADDADFIESFDYFESNWIKGGLKKERLIYRHFFNERKNQRLFYASMNLQRRFKLQRKLPADIQIRIGSQWWCLRRETVEAVFEFLKTRRDVARFFTHTWIPDETFFQTVVSHLVPESQIRTRTLTFLMFSEYGMPVTFYNDHYDMLIGQDYLFARKISPDADDLKRRLGQLYSEVDTTFQISNEGPGLFKFLTGRGRVGRRFAQRFWEQGSTLGRERELLIVVCKKWHVAKRLLDRIRHNTDLPTTAYLFDEDDTPLPDLGGLQNGLEKRARHRRALVRMLFDHFETDRMVVCMDPSNIDVLQDFAADRSVTRLLEIDCTFSDDYLMGHAMRIGLAGDQTTACTLERLLPTLRNDLVFESDQIRDAEFLHHTRIRETADHDENSRAVAQFLSVPQDVARDIVSAPHLFAD